MNITLEQAEKAIAAAKNKATEINTKMDICVVDAGANLVAFARMDGAWIGSIDISHKKARQHGLQWIQLLWWMLFSLERHFIISNIQMED